MHCVPMMPGTTCILQFKVVVVTLSLCEFACEATTVRQAFNSNTPVNKAEIACQIQSQSTLPAL